MGPMAKLIARSHGQTDDGTPAFGSDCMTRREIDDLINDMVLDLEAARTQWTVNQKQSKGRRRMKTLKAG